MCGREAPQIFWPWLAGSVWGRSQAAVAPRLLLWPPFGGASRGRAAERARLGLRRSALATHARPQKKSEAAPVSFVCVAHPSTPPQSRRRPPCRRRRAPCLPRRRQVRRMRGPKKGSAARKQEAEPHARGTRDPLVRPPPRARRLSAFIHTGALTHHETLSHPLLTKTHQAPPSPRPAAARRPRPGRTSCSTRSASSRPRFGR